METKIIAESPSWQFIQVGVVVKNMDEAVKRFTALGIGPFYSKQPPASSIETFRGKPLNAKLIINATMVGGIELELIQPVDGESPHMEYFNSKGEGIQHIAFKVDNLDEEVERLEKNGCTPLLHARWGKGGVDYVDLNTSGVVVELVKPME
jgi:methylmalonyl-CoA/ethylmalonyl-CoA epimerase